MNQLSLPFRLRPLLIAGVFSFAVNPAFALEMSPIPASSPVASAFSLAEDATDLPACLDDADAKGALLTRLTHSRAQLEPGYIPVDDFGAAGSAESVRTAAVVSSSSAPVIARAPKMSPKAPTLSASFSQSYFASIPQDLGEKARALSAHIVAKFKVDQAHANHVVSSAMHTANKHGLPHTLVLAVIAVESSFNAAARNGGARGLMQIIPFWHKDKVKAVGGPEELMKVDNNIAAGSAILKEYIDRKGSVFKGLTQYNASSRAKEYSAKVLKQKNGFEAVVAKP